ncbi:hypothetical protein C4568_01375 [Candidatus Parcubacteria bacterium]|nr:MAG: hypothetical protein C4568_01375 [Candidatus Parcubacteria bacterium]
MTRKNPRSTDDRLDELMGFMKKHFERIEVRFDSVDKRFDGIDKRLNLQQDVLVTHNKMLEDVLEDVRDLRHGQLEHDKRFDALESTVRGISRAIDKDSVKVIDHERRIKRLEYKSMR